MSQSAPRPSAPYEPSPAEIAEAARRIREVGFWEQRSDYRHGQPRYHGPWGSDRTAGLSVPAEAQVVSLADLRAEAS